MEVEIEDEIEIEVADQNLPKVLAVVVVHGERKWMILDELVVHEQTEKMRKKKMMKTAITEGRTGIEIEEEPATIMVVVEVVVAKEEGLGGTLHTYFS